MNIIKDNKILYIKLLSETAKLPKNAYKGDAGFDLYSDEDVEIKEWKKGIIKTSIILEIPEGLYGKICSRSGLSCNHDLEVGAGIIDENYRGEIKVILRNFSDFPYFVKKGDKIAQIIFHKYYSLDILICKELDTSERNDKGFGSSNNL